MFAGWQRPYKKPKMKQKQPRPPNPNGSNQINPVSNAGLLDGNVRIRNQNRNKSNQSNQSGLKCGFAGGNVRIRNQK